jgi:type II secretory pathway component PulM
MSDCYDPTFSNRREDAADEARIGMGFLIGGFAFCLSSVTFWLFVCPLMARTGSEQVYHRLHEGDG